MGKSFERMHSRLPADPGEARPTTAPRSRRLGGVEAGAEAASSGKAAPFWTDTAQTIPFVEVPFENVDTLPLPPLTTDEPDDTPELRILPDELAATPRLQRVETGPIYPEALLQRVAPLRDPEGEPARQYRQLAGQLMEHLPAQAAVLALVPLERLGRALDLTAALGVALAATTQQPILLVDATRHDDGLAGRFGLVGDPGWEEVVLGQAAVQAIQHVGPAWLDLLPAGKRLARTSTARWARQGRKILHQLARHYRLVVTATPPWNLSPYASLMADASDALCVVVEPNEVGLPAERQCLDALMGMGRTVLGTIVLQDI
jgi:Mrp family chromosome partitioning ATPase